MAWFQLITPDTGLPDPQSRIPVKADQLVELVPGMYQVHFKLGSESFYVYRTVPAVDEGPVPSIAGVVPNHLTWLESRGQVILPAIELKSTAAISQNMSFISGGQLVARSSIGLLKNHQCQLTPYLMDRRQVSWEEIKKIFPEYRSNTYTTPDEGPASGIPFSLAIAYAEKVGKQLPTAWQWLWAATNGGTTRYPWGDETFETAWPQDENLGTGVDLNRAEPAVIGLYSGLLEWADTPAPSPQQKPGGSIFNPRGARAVVGGPLDFARPNSRLSAQSDPMQFGFFSAIGYYPQVGFRCVRNLSSE
jgi:hypothetical protein